ncbi:MAG: amidohydrolase [Spirochaetales bacterium]|nr:amidohydrolase [Spirochaetales bacterium]
MKKKEMFITLILITMLILIGCQTPGNEGGRNGSIGVDNKFNSTSNGTADVVLRNGFIYTVDAESTTAEAMAVDGDVIIYIGDDKGVEVFISEETRVIDLKGRMVMPGMYDAHAHPLWQYPDWIFGVDMTSAKSEGEYLALLKDFVNENPELTVIKGSGWDNPYFPQIGPRKELIDAIVPDKPVVLLNINGHSSWVNSKALELLGIDSETENPQGGYIIKDPETGEPTGLLKEEAMYLAEELLPEYTDEQYRKALLSYQSDAHSFGLIGVNEAWLNDDYLSALESAETDGVLKMRYAGEWWIEEKDDAIPDEINKAVEIAKRNKGGNFQLTGAKFFADGTVEEWTAWLSEDYADGNNEFNRPQWDDLELFTRAVVDADKKGLRVHFHAIGDLGLKLAVDAIEQAVKVNPEWDRRSAITHLQVVDDKEMDRMGSLDIVALPQPVWFTKGDYFDNIEVPALGFERASKEYPMKSLFDRGITVASSTDTIAAFLDPLYGLQMAVTRVEPGYGLDPDNPEDVLGPEERISLEQAIESYTINGAYSMYVDDITGSLETGKKADYIILSDNLFNYENHPEDIFENVSVVLTSFNGEIVYESE